MPRILLVKRSIRLSHDHEEPEKSFTQLESKTVMTYETENGNSVEFLDFLFF